MAAIFRYALDGNGDIKAKGKLKNGEIRKMDKETEENNPDFTKIGDKQYHHFNIDVSSDSKKLIVTLDGKDGFNFNLYLKKGDFSFRSICDLADTSQGSDKSISINASPGTWYIGVECASTVETQRTDWGYKYSGKLEVLNGIDYSIKADLGAVGIDEDNSFDKKLPIQFNLVVSKRNLYIKVLNSKTYILKIYDSKGKLCWRSSSPLNARKHCWQAGSNGLYILYMESKKGTGVRHFTIIN